MGKSDKAKGVSVFSPSTGLRMGQQEAAADAAQAAAMAQQEQARRAYKQVANIINPATVQGLAALDRDIGRQEKNLSRQEQLISQIDPTVIEASQQALRLLRGEESSTLAPFKQQRTMQRQKLVNSLRERLGPGAETSTAGMQALSRFDSETSNLFAGAQQQALGNLGTVSAQFTAQRPDMFREIMGLSSLGQAKTALNYQRADTLYRARQPLMGTAGAQHTGALMNAQSNAAMIGGLQNLGMQAVGAYFTGGASLAAGAAAKKGGPTDGGSTATHEGAGDWEAYMRS